MQNYKNRSKNAQYWSAKIKFRPKFYSLETPPTRLYAPYFPITVIFFFPAKIVIRIYGNIAARYQVMVSRSYGEKSEIRLILLIFEENLYLGGGR